MTPVRGSNSNAPTSPPPGSPEQTSTQITESKPLVFVSHRQEDEALAKLVGHFVNECTAGRTERFLSSLGEAVGPTPGIPLKDGLEDGLRQAELVLFVYTLRSADWTWAAWECGVARGLGKTVVALQAIESDLPKLFEGDTHIELWNEESVHRLGRLLLHPRTFPSKGVSLADWSDQDLKAKAKTLVESTELIRDELVRKSSTVRPNPVIRIETPAPNKSNEISPDDVLVTVDSRSALRLLDMETSTSFTARWRDLRGTISEQNDELAKELSVLTKAFKMPAGRVGRLRSRFYAPNDRVFQPVIWQMSRTKTNGVTYEMVFHPLEDEAFEVSPSTFTSEERFIQPYRTLFYHYHVTKIAGDYVWRLAQIDFGNSSGLGKLETTISVLDQDGKSHSYRIEAGLRGDRFLMFESASVGSEPCLVEIFPFMGKAFISHHCGLLILESWDGTHLVSPCIMSRTAIANYEEEGCVDDDLSRRLDAIWSQAFFKKNVITPHLQQQGEVD